MLQNTDDEKNMQERRSKIFFTICIVYKLRTLTYEDLQQGKNNDVRLHSFDFEIEALTHTNSMSTSPFGPLNRGYHVSYLNNLAEGKNDAESYFSEAGETENTVSEEISPEDPKKLNPYL